MATIGCNQRLALVPTVTAGSYSAGNDVGGLMKFTLQRDLGGIFNYFGLQSAGGLTATLICFVFDQNPSSSTFTDNGTFTLAATDLPKLVLAPFSLTLAAPSEGTTASFAENSDLSREFGNGLTGNGYMWVALCAGGSMTPGSTTDLKVIIGATLD